jgi:hypothetical protein
MTIICWTLMKSEDKKTKVGYSVNIRILMMQSNELTHFSEDWQHYFIHFTNTIKHLKDLSHVARMGENRNTYRLLVGKPEGKEATRKTKT